MVRVRFERVKFSAAKRYKCATCGKTVRRQRTFEQTLSPWNKNAAGEEATRSEVVEKLRAEAAAWGAAPDYCTDCWLRAGKMRSAGR
jgi:hypothetical protein